MLPAGMRHSIMRLVNNEAPFLDQGIPNPGR